ncbi:MAG: hypothetical protein B6D41_08720 [Chloroflexi bacterium UTCFX4]|nr:MAG: hypothetical protein B6D41_08720 [Chloroflexi bacterium UTCFX4]
MPNELSLEFTTDELYLLYSLFGPALAFGVGEPYLGKFIEEIEAAQRAALDSLIARDLIRVVENDQVMLDEVLAKIIQTCAQPSATIIITIQRRAYNQVMHYLNFGPEMLVQHTPRASHQHRLVALPPDAGAARVAKILHLNGQSAAAGSAFAIDQEKLFQARDAVFNNNLADAQHILATSGLSQSQAQQLARALTNAISNSSTVILANRNSPDAPHVSGIGILDSLEGLWAMNLQPHDQETRIEFVPSSAAEILERLHTLMASLSANWTL